MKYGGQIAGLLALAVCSAQVRAEGQTPVRGLQDPKLVGILQKIVDEKSALYNCSVAIGIKTDNVTAEAVAGESDMSDAHVKAKVTDPYVWGSITKITTGVAVLRLAEAHKLDLDANVSAIVNPLLAKMANNKTIGMNFTTLADLWGPEVDAVTIRHLATMMSGVPDFDTAAGTGRSSTDSFRAAVLKDPTHDFIPTQLLSFPWVAKGALDFPPGSAFSYSSSNFALLGLALAASTGADTWDAYDQVRLPHCLNPRRVNPVVYFLQSLNRRPSAIAITNSD